MPATCNKFYVDDTYLAMLAHLLPVLYFIVHLVFLLFAAVRNVEFKKTK